MDPARRQALIAAKLRALVRDQEGDVALEPGTFPGGAAALAGGAAYVLAEDDPGRALGPALAWTTKQGVRTLRLFVNAAGGDLARRAAAFDLDIEVLEVEGRDAVRAEPTALPSHPPVSDDDRRFESVLEQAGADVVEEHGALLGEVRGLEVARVVDGRLEIGVGKHDREAHRELLGESEASVEALFAVVRTVVEQRAPGGEGHAAFHLAPERWLRWVVMHRPELVGATELELRPSPVPRPDLRRPAPAPAIDRATGTVYVFSVGVDVDLVPAAVDAGAHVLVVPEADAHRVTTDLAALLKEPATVKTVPNDWRATYP